MKKMMMIGSALLVLSSSAFASQARLLALGMNETDNEGMYYISDSRNIFLNPAYVNLYPNQAVLEWGNTGTNASVLGTNSAATLNSSTSPKAQGGVFKKYGDFVYGIYFGNESNTSSLLRIAATSALSSVDGITNAGTFAGTNSKMLQTADNQVDLFFGGEAGLKWAGNVAFANGKDESRNSKDAGAAIRAGLIGLNWDAHVNVSTNSKSEASEAITAAGLGIVTPVTVSQKFEGKLGVQVGGSYLLDGSNRLFGYVKRYGWDQTDSFNGYGGAIAAIGGQNGTVKGDFTSYYLGWGRDFGVNNDAKLFTSLAAKKTDINLKFTRKSEVRNTTVPLTLGYEVKATDWLTLRGSIVQNLYGHKDNKNISNAGATGTQLNPVARGLIANIYGGTGKGTIANSTVVNAGAALNFGQLTVDGLIGTTDSVGAASSTSKKGVLSLANLETSVGVTYKF